MGLFSRKSDPLKDPANWDLLWSYVGPYGGRVTPAGAKLCAQYAQRLSDEELVGTGRQLELAYLALDTEKHAQHIGGHPWRGKKYMFSRARFLRAVDAAIVAGPNALVRVRDDPSLIAEFDSGLEVAPYEEADPPGTLGMRLVASCEAKGVEYESRYVGLDYAWPEWPKLDLMFRSLPLDPEWGWVQASVVGGSDDDDVAWGPACEIVQRRFFSLFGGPIERRLSYGTFYIRATATPFSFWEDGTPGVERIKAPEFVGYSQIEPVSHDVQFLMSPQEMSLRDLDEQVRLLTWKVSVLICAGTFDFPEEALERIRLLRDETAV